MTDAVKRRIIAEAARVLRPGGRLGLHELLLTPNDISASEKRRIGTDISRAVRVGARPLTRAEWIALLDEGGFTVRTCRPAPLLLLAPSAMIRDEGVAGTVRLLGRILRSRVTTRRVARLWRTMPANAATSAPSRSSRNAGPIPRRGRCRQVLSLSSMCPPAAATSASRSPCGTTAAPAARSGWG